MDPKKLFFDQRHSGYCAYCGNWPTTRDHVPSRVLLDEPFPDNLPVVPACDACNNGFSVDEVYVACLIECALTGGAEKVSREKISRILKDSPHLAATIADAKQVDAEGSTIWQADQERVRNVILKLARGHVMYEVAETCHEEPEGWNCVARPMMSSEQLTRFEAVPMFTVWPEIGSRAFIRAATGFGPFTQNGWEVIQPGRYRYLVDHGTMSVRICLSEYIACEVWW